MGKRFAILGYIFGVALVSTPALAQNQQDAAIESARLRTGQVSLRQAQEALSLPLGVNVNQLPVSTAGDLDLGIQVVMKRKEAEQPFRFFADTAAFSTNNVALTKTGRQGDSYFFGDAGFTYDHAIAEDLRVEATVRQSFFRYGTYSQLDFEDMNAGTGLTYQWKKMWDLTLFGRYNFERMTQGDAGSDFFQNHTITVGAQKTFSFANGNYAYAGYSSIFGFSTPVVSQRDEHGFFLGTHYNFTRKISGEIYYRIAVFPYEKGGRTDLNQTAVISLAYVFNDYARLTASVSLTSDRSNHSVYDYDVINTGGGLALQIRF